LLDVLLEPLLEDRVTAKEAVEVLTGQYSRKQVHHSLLRQVEDL